MRSIRTSGTELARGQSGEEPGSDLRSDGSSPAGSSVSGSGALKRILPALVASSVLGYAVQIVAPLLVSAKDYVQFSAFWSCLFLGVMALSGVQNEVARSSSPAPAANRSVLGKYSFVIAAVAAVGGAVMGGVLSVVLHITDGLVPVAAAVGLLGYSLLAVIAGVMYGAHRWNGVAVAIIADPLLRALLFVCLGVAVFASVVATVPLPVIVSATVVPFALAATLMWFCAGGRPVMSTVAIEGTWQQLLRRSFHTVLAACALGFMASGQPLVIAAIARDENPALVAGTILVVVLVRAPLVSPMVALQSYLTVTFRDDRARIGRRVAFLSAGLMAVTVIAAVLVTLAGPAVLRVLLPAYMLPHEYVLGVSVLAAGVVGVQCIVGAAVLGVGGHRSYAAGWLTTALAVAALAFVPLPFEPRLVLILLGPGVLGLGVHLWSLRAALSAPDRGQGRMSAGGGVR